MDGIELVFICFALGGAFCTRLRPGASAAVSMSISDTSLSFPKISTSSDLVPIPPEPESSVLDVLEDDRD